MESIDSVPIVLESIILGDIVRDGMEWIKLNIILCFSLGPDSFYAHVVTMAFRTATVTWFRNGTDAFTFEMIDSVLVT